jgi:hypothetical protein
MFKGRDSSDDDPDSVPHPLTIEDMLTIEDFKNHITAI